MSVAAADTTPSMNRHRLLDEALARHDWATADEHLPHVPWALITIPSYREGVIRVLVKHPDVFIPSDTPLPFHTHDAGDRIAVVGCLMDVPHLHLLLHRRSASVPLMEPSALRRCAVIAIGRSVLAGQVAQRADVYQAIACLNTIARNQAANGQSGPWLAAARWRDPVVGLLAATAAQEGPAQQAAIRHLSAFMDDATSP
jgi:hypothetical protein